MFNLNKCIYHLNISICIIFRILTYLLIANILYLELYNISNNLLYIIEYLIFIICISEVGIFWSFYSNHYLTNIIKTVFLIINSVLLIFGSIIIYWKNILLLENLIIIISIKLFGIIHIVYNFCNLRNSSVILPSFEESNVNILKRLKLERENLACRIIQDNYRNYSNYRNRSCHIIV